MKGLMQKPPLTTFMHACIDGNIELLTLELRRGVDIDQKDESGYDCRQIARLLGWRAISNLLRSERERIGTTTRKRQR